VPVEATTSTSTSLDVGDSWQIGILVTDDDGYASTATVAVQVSDPAGSLTAATATEDSTGYFLAEHTITSAGRYLAVATVSGTVVGVVPFTTWAAAPTTADQMPSVEDAVAYLGETSATDEEIADALLAEAAAQRARCRVPAVYPADLRQALLRRVARNLAARAVPVATYTSFEGGGTSARVPQTDAEIARLEAPHRRLTTG